MFLIQIPKNRSSQKVFYSIKTLFDLKLTLRIIDSLV